MPSVKPNVPEPDSAPIVLVDGSSYLYRAFHAMPPLTNSTGQPTGAVHGVVNMLRRLIADYDPKSMAVVFDAKGKTFRDDIYKEYKANRPSMPDDLRSQIEPLHKIVKAMGLPLIIEPGVEADDVIGTLAHQASERKLKTIISTGDKDMAQLVDDHVTLINTMTNTVMDASGVEEKFGVRPDQIIDYLSLVGDTSDNIPGVPSCGPKTAVKWLAAHGTLEAVIENADGVKGKIGEKLRAAIDHLPMSKDLATIRTELELGQNIEAIELQAPDLDRLAKLYGELEFKTFAKELADGKSPLLPGSVARANPAAAKAIADSGAVAAVTGNASGDYTTITTMKELDAWLAKLKKAEVFAFDTETTSLNYMQAEVVGLSFAVEPGKAAYVPLAHDYEDAPKQLDRDAVLAKFKPLLEQKKNNLVGQHIKYDINVLRKYDIHLCNVAHDTMLQSYVLDSTATRHDMDSLARKYLGVNTIKFEDIAGKGKKQLTFNQIPIEQASPYAAEDADITLQLHLALWPQLEKNAELKALYEDVEIPLLSALAIVEYQGVLIDADKLKKQGVVLHKKLEEVQSEAFTDAGKEFNLGSPKQIQEIFFEEKQFPIIRKTPKGQPSTAEDVLETLALDYPLPKLILQHRSLSKLLSTYIDKLP